MTIPAPTPHTKHKSASSPPRRRRPCRSMGFMSSMLGPTFGGPGAPRRSLHPRVERVAQTVAEEVEAQHGYEDREAGKESQPGILVDEGDVGLEIPSPARRRRLGAEPEERQGSLDDDRGGDPERGG